MSKIKLGKIADSIFDGKHGDCKNQPGSGLYFISVKDLKEYDIDYSNAREITPNDFKQNYTRTNLDNGDTIYANTGDTIGKSLFVKDNPLVYKTSFQKSVAIVKPNIEFVEPRYLYYLLKYETPRLRQAATGSGQKNLLLSTMRDFEVTIHDRNLQKNIISVLGLLDDKIRINIEINDILHQMAKTLYDYWFVQFDFPDENGKPYRTSGGEMVWNEQLKREIPKGWEVKNISDICEIISGYPFQSSTYSKTGKYRLITIKNVQDSGIDLNVDNYIKDLPENLPSYCILSPGDILMSLTGNVGRVGLMYADDCLLNQRVALIKPKHSYLNVFLYFLFKSNRLKMLMENISTGTSQKNLSPVDTGNLVIPFNTETVKLFCDKLESIVTKIVSAEKEKVELTKLRDWLLPMLMNGQARVE